MLVNNLTKMPEECECNKNICHEKGDVTHEVFITYLLGIAGRVPSYLIERTKGKNYISLG